jgi:hypothetical protein
MDPKAIEATLHNAAAAGVTGLTARVEAFPPDDAVEGVDVLVCNPPYFRLGFMGLARLSGQAADDLLLTKAILRHGTRFARRIFFTYSSAAAAELEPDLARLASSGGTLRILRTVRFPLTIVPDSASGHPLPPGVFRDGPLKEFELWHDVHMCEFRSQ